MITKMNRLAKDNECLFMQDRARAHTAKLILEILKDKKHFRLLESDHWLLNSPDSNPVDFGIWGAELNKMYTKAEGYPIWIP